MMHVSMPACPPQKTSCTNTGKRGNKEQEEKLVYYIGFVVYQQCLLIGQIDFYMEHRHEYMDTSSCTIISNLQTRQKKIGAFLVLDT